jgi:heme exporter protein A
MTHAQLAAPWLSVRDLHLWRGTSHVLRGLSFEACAGEVWVLEGVNGSGKTSLLRVLAGLIWPEEGSVQWHIKSTSTAPDEGAGMFSYLAHESALHDDLSAIENVLSATQLRRVCTEDEARAALQRLGVQADDRAVRLFSAGQRRRIALARVLLSDAPVWLLDEPWTHLDMSGLLLFQQIIESKVMGGGLVMLSAHHGIDLPSNALRRLAMS